MTIEDFNEEEFQIIASSDQLFEDLPLTRVIINDLDFGFECNECQRFSTRTASERERVESIEHQPWCKTAFFPALLGLLGIGAGAGAAAGTAAAGTAAGAAGATAAGTAGATAAGTAAAGTIAAEGAAVAGTGAAASTAAAAEGAAAGAIGAGEVAAATAPALAEGAGAASLSGAGSAASPGLAAKVLDFAKQPMVQQGLTQFNNNQAQKQQEREQQEQTNELARQSSAKWARIIITHSPGRDITEGEFAGATFVGQERGQSRYVFDGKTGPVKSFNKHQFSICDGCGEVYHPPHRPENPETGHVEWQSRNLGHHASSHFGSCATLQRRVINNESEYPDEYRSLQRSKMHEARDGSRRLHPDLSDDEVASIRPITREEFLRPTGPGPQNSIATKGQINMADEYEAAGLFASTPQ